MSVLRALISFYGYIRFDQPRLVTATGVGLALGVGLIHLYEFPGHLEASAYAGVAFAAVAVGSLVSAVGMLRGAKGWGWALGAAISFAAFVAYVVSRTLGLPGLEEFVGRWDYPTGTVAMALEGLYLALYSSVVAGMNVAYPERHGWHD